MKQSGAECAADVARQKMQWALTVPRGLSTLLWKKFLWKKFKLFVQFSSRVTPMDILIAIMCYFGLLTPQTGGLTPAQVDQLLQNNQTTVQYYVNSPEAYEALVAQRAQIDRAEDWSRISLFSFFTKTLNLKRTTTCLQHANTHTRSTAAKRTDFLANVDQQTKTITDDGNKHKQQLNSKG